MATNTHHPTDSTLLYDGVRVLSRMLAKAKQTVQAGTAVTHTAFRGHTRSAKRQMQRLIEAARQRVAQAEEQLHTAYQRLLEITRATVKQAQQVEVLLTVQQTHARGRLAATRRQIVPLIQPVRTQTPRRVFYGAVVPALEKGVSLFEPHTAILRTGKPGQPTEFGRVI